ncbi:hypothetical protein ACWGUP_28835, partial [Streptomyces diastaticus]
RTPRRLHLPGLQPDLLETPQEDPHMIVLRALREAGHFVRWALAQRIARDLSFPAVKWNGPSQAMDDDARWATARRLLHDDTIRTEGRLAVLLLLLYAQWPAAISRLTTAHVEKTDGAVRIRLGDVAVTLPGLIAEMALEQVAARRSHAVLAQTDFPWLFPGGQPGRPISAWAMSERLRELGIRLAETRSPPSCPPRSSPAPSASTSTSPSNGSEPLRRLGRLRRRGQPTLSPAHQPLRSRHRTGHPMTTSDLSSGWLANWQHEITAMLQQTLAHFETAYGYPAGDNDVLVADDQSRAMAARLEDAAVPAALVTFYSSIAELQLPDIDHGYFIHSPDLVLDHLAEYGPVRLADDRTGIVFGSDGGGILFALDQSGQVHRSTTASWFDEFELAAPSLTQFLEQLHRATVVFTDETKRHSATERS